MSRSPRDYAAEATWIKYGVTQDMIWAREWVANGCFTDGEATYTGYNKDVAEYDDTGARRIAPYRKRVTRDELIASDPQAQKIATALAFANKLAQEKRNKQRIEEMRRMERCATNGPYDEPYNIEEAA